MATRSDPQDRIEPRAATGAVQSAGAAWRSLVRARIRGFLRPIASLVAWHLIAIHFILILLAVTGGWARLPDHTVSRVVLLVSNYYADLTFHNRDFGFFAPEVYADWTLHLVGTTASGAVAEYAFPTTNRELVIKYYSMIGRSAGNEAREFYGRSWADWIMRHHEEVVSVDVIVNRNIIPSMEEFRNGDRIREAEEPEYRATFDRNSS